MDNHNPYSLNAHELTTPFLLTQSVLSDSVVIGTNTLPSIGPAITIGPSQSQASQQDMGSWNPESTLPLLDPVLHAHAEVSTWKEQCSQTDPSKSWIYSTVVDEEIGSQNINVGSTFESQTAGWTVLPMGLIRSRRDNNRWTEAGFAKSGAKDQRVQSAEQHDPYTFNGQQTSLSNASSTGPTLAPSLPVIAPPIGTADMSLQTGNQMGSWVQTNRYGYGMSWLDQQSRSNGYQPYPRNTTLTHYLENKNRILRSPSVVEELGPRTKAIIDDYLLRYLNYLCMNYEAVDPTGRRIHQQYTIRRIEREEQLYGWRPLKFRIEAFVNAFIDILKKEGISYDVITHIPHYLSRSKIFSRFNESGNRMKSQGQNIWRVKARYKHTSGFRGYYSMEVFDQPAQGYPILPMTTGPIRVHYDPSRMLCHDPLLWEFLPYERSIVGQPPIAVAGKPWQWNLRLHDHWASRKAVRWKLIVDPESLSPSLGTGGSHGSPPGSPSISWLSIRESQLVGTPLRPGSYPINIEAVCHDDNRAEPVVVRGSFTINVTRAAVWTRSRKSPSATGESDEPERGRHDGVTFDESPTSPIEQLEHYYQMS